MKEWQTPEVTEIELRANEDVLQHCQVPSMEDPIPLCVMPGMCPDL